MSLRSILQIAQTGLRTQQQALNVVAHNIANASTEGYSRQRAVISGNSPLRTADGVFGTGVRVEDVVRIRDKLLDGVYYREISSATEQESRAGMLGRVEGLFGEPSELGLAAALDNFYSAWSELGSNPASDTVRSVVRQSATVLVDKLHELNAQADLIRQEVDTRLTVGAEKASALAADVARLNQQIVSVEADGATAGDLRDARARALTELADLMPIRVTERDNGSVGVNSSGIGIIDGAYSLDLEARSSAGTWGIAAVGRPGLFSDPGGRLGGLLEVLNTDLPMVQKSLDDLSSALVTEVNAVHTTGTNPDGTTGIDFFDGTGTTASSIALSTEVLASVGAISAGTPDGLGAYRAGANDIAMALAGLRDTDIGSLGTTMGGHYQGLVSDVGQAVRSSSDAAEVRRVLADQADVRRMGQSGVSVDEELVTMIEFQTAYQASARVLTTADEMLQTLLAI
jgi:flagellar hook-associated protein 1